MGSLKVEMPESHSKAFATLKITGFDEETFRWLKAMKHEDARRTLVELLGTFRKIGESSGEAWAKRKIGGVWFDEEAAYMNVYRDE
jgi:hypothetical protein